MIIKDLKKFSEKKYDSKKDHKPLPRKVHAILLLFGLCLNLVSYSQDVTHIKASVSGTLNCENTSVTLTCNTDVKGAVYRWTGPNGYTSNNQNPITTLPGNYEVSVTDPLTSITSTSSVTVSIDTIRPKEVKATSSGMLTCKDILVNLEGNSATPGVNYEWQGPKNFNSNEKKTVVFIPGIYTLTVTNPANGCSVTTNLNIAQNTKPPEDVNATVSGVLTCNTQKVKLVGTSSTKDVKYRWTGQDLTTASHTFEVSKPGFYELEVTNPENGCSSKASVTVEQDIKPPSEVIATTSDTITCKKSSVKLTASSTTKGAIFEWSKEDSFISSEDFLRTSTPGNYALQITNPENGCSINQTVTVIKDINPPKDIKIISSGEITCNDKMVTLTCTSSTPDVMYKWNETDNFSSKSSTINVEKKGTYYVEATKISNGCSVTESLTVTENISHPKDITAISSGIISCETTLVKLSGKSSTPKVHFTWTGPDGFMSELQEPEVNLPGKYMLTATDSLNGCKSETSIIVQGEVCEKNKIK